MKGFFLGFSFAVMALLVACGGGSGTNSGSQERKNFSDSGSNDDGKSSDSEGNSSSLEGDKNENGSVYNADENTLTDLRDGQIYRIVKIDSQIWMAENLNYEVESSWCYDNDTANCAKYGRLYTWAAAMDSVGTWSTNGKECGYNKTCSPTSPVRGVCPKGWHLPGIGEFFDELITVVGGSSTAGSKLKSATGWNDNGNGTDTYSFSALPAGIRYSDGDFSSVGKNAFFWSSSANDSVSAYTVSLIDYNDGAGLGFSGKYSGISVRCLKD